MHLINYNVCLIVFRVWFQIILLLITCVENDYIEYELVQKLFKNYDSSLRPSRIYNSSLNVTFGLALVQLIDVDERNLVITTNCWLNQV
jgi:nicotinic acetylcholine receptor, invertebrate